MYPLEIINSFYFLEVLHPGNDIAELIVKNERSTCLDCEATCLLRTDKVLEADVESRVQEHSLELPACAEGVVGASIS